MHMVHGCACASLLVFMLWNIHLSVCERQSVGHMVVFRGPPQEWTTPQSLMPPSVVWDHVYTKDVANRTEKHAQTNVSVYMCVRVCICMQVCVWSRWEEREKLERGKRRVATESLREHVCVCVCVGLRGLWGVRRRQKGEERGSSAVRHPESVNIFLAGLLCAPGCVPSSEANLNKLLLQPSAGPAG